MTTKPNKYSWNNNASMLFIDQPAGTGFSMGDPATDYDHNEKEVSRDMYNFLQVLRLYQVSIKACSRRYDTDATQEARK